jgi:hypothetical protein
MEEVGQFFSEENVGNVSYVLNFIRPFSLIDILQGYRSEPNVVFRYETSIGAKRPTFFPVNI